MTTKEIREKLEGIIDTSTNQSLKETNGIKHIGIDPEKNVVTVIVAIGKKGGMEELKLRRDLATKVKIDLGFTGIKIQIEEKRVLESVVNREVKFIIVSSGKGGVGKSTVAANLAYALKRQGKNVGLIDADIYGSSLPKILEMEHAYPTGDGNGHISPFTSFGIEIMSTEFFAEDGKPIIWRGAMLNSMISNLFYEVSWNKNIDYMVIDAPPGTGDVALDLRTIVPKAEMILVTTPHLAASHVAVKAGLAAIEMKHNIIGVVENMSYYINPVNNQKEYIFGKGGGIEVSEKLGSELLCQIPINQPTHHLSLYESDEEIGKLYDDLALIVITR